MSTQTEGSVRQSTRATSSEIRVVPLTPDDEPAYARFLLEHEHALIYATLPFRDFLADAVGGKPLYLIARQSDAVCGVLPCFNYESELGAVMNSLPWYGSHGGCLVAGPSARAARAALLARFLRETSDPSVLSATIILSPFDTAMDEYVEDIGHVVRDHRIGQITRLPERSGNAEKKLEAIYRQKTRNLVRKSQRQGFDEVVTDDDWAWRFLQEVHTENMRAIGGRPKPSTHFEALRRRIPPDWRRLSVAVHGRERVAALLLLRFQRKVEYVTPVVRREYRSTQALSFLIHRAMLEMVASGATLWNWGGTWLSQQSLHHFKAGWGAKDFPYSYLIRATDSGLARLRQHRESLVDSFPYYYTYPFNKLETDVDA
jgi:hypothetical protein